MSMSDWLDRCFTAAFLDFSGHLETAEQAVNNTDISSPYKVFYGKHFSKNVLIWPPDECKSNIHSPFFSILFSTNTPLTLALSASR